MALFQRWLRLSAKKVAAADAEEGHAAGLRAHGKGSSAEQISTGRILLLSAQENTARQK